MRARMLVAAFLWMTLLTFVERYILARPSGANSSAPDSKSELKVQVRDRAGNLTSIDRVFSVSPRSLPTTK